jgi:hypothetical protein
MSGAPRASFNIRIIIRPISIANFESSRILDFRSPRSRQAKGGEHIPLKDSGGVAEQIASNGNEQSEPNDEYEYHVTSTRMTVLDKMPLLQG